MDKVILITGASSGIGEGIARELGMTGAKVLLGARRVERIEAIATEICRAGGIAKARELDVTDRQSMADFVQAALDSWGRVDVLINNAGVMPLSPLAAGKQDEWALTIDVNIKGVGNWRCTSGDGSTGFRSDNQSWFYWCPFCCAHRRSLLCIKICSTGYF